MVMSDMPAHYCANTVGVDVSLCVQEAETAELLGQVEWLEGEAGHNADELGLAAENAKLKYRIGHLNKVINEYI